MDVGIHPLARPVVASLAVLVAACGREEPDPPLIPLPTGAAAPAPTPPAVVAPGPAVTAPQQPAPGATAAATTTRPAAPAPTTTGAAPALTVPFTPFPIPIPAVLPLPTAFPLPTALPPLPTGLPGLPPLFPAPSTADAGAPPPPAPTSTPAAADPRVIEYGATWCGACQQLKRELTARAIPFTFVDVEDAKAMSSPAGRRAAEMPAHMRRAVPATRVVRRDASVDWVSGCDPDRIERAYR